MQRKLKAIDFFCSGGGMSFGIQQAGIEVLAGIDIDKNCRETYVSNINNSKFICADISNFKEKELLNYVEVNVADDNLIFIGCSPCQYWSIMRTSRSKSEKGKNLLCDFQRFVEYYKPGFIIVENVPGIFRRREESGLDIFINTIEWMGYTVKYKVLDLSYYGVPQSRKRFSLIASRTNSNIDFPEPDEIQKTVKSVIGDKNLFPEISAGHSDQTAFLHTTPKLSDLNIKRLEMTHVDGGSRAAWSDTNLQLETYKKNNAYFKDTYSRMYWNKPAPTITTKFYSISNGRFVHPEQNRAISLREGATLQTFPINYTFKGKSLAKIAKIIGNAVPPIYAKKLGHAIKKSL